MGRTGSLRPDPWLARLLGKPVFELALDNSHAIDAVKDASGEALFAAKVPARRVELAQSLESAGFHLVTTQVRLSAHSIDTGGREAYEVGFATEDDAPRVTELAGRCFRYSRFHADPQIPVRIANAIKEAWAQAFFTGDRGDHMVLARDDRSVIGFLQLLRPEPEQLVIDLIGVDDRYQRRGIARSMIRFATRHCKPVDTLDVGTQITNDASLRLYTRLGFAPYAFDYVFHLHKS